MSTTKSFPTFYNNSYFLMIGLDPVAYAPLVCVSEGIAFEDFQKKLEPILRARSAVGSMTRSAAIYRR